LKNKDKRRLHFTEPSQKKKLLAFLPPLFYSTDLLFQVYKQKTGNKEKDINCSYERFFLIMIEPEKSIAVAFVLGKGYKRCDLCPTLVRLLNTT